MKSCYRIHLAALVLALVASVASAAPLTEIDYLKSHSRDVGADGAALAFDRDFYRKRLFVLGEVHGIAAGQPLDLAILRHLNSRAGVRVYVAEVDVAQAARFNAYLADGDQRHLQTVFADWTAEDAQWGNQDFFNKIVSVRRLNQSLRESRRIRFVGADQLQNPALAREFLTGLMTGLELSGWPEGVAFRQRLVGEDPAPTVRAMIADLQAVRASMPADAPRGIPQTRWRELRVALVSLAGAPRQGREDRITANIERLFDEPAMRGQKAYGLWGLFHVIQARVSGASPLAYRLGRSGGPLAGQVGSILTVALNSQMMMPSAALPAFARGKGRYVDMPYTMDNEKAVLLNGIGPISATAKARTTLVRLDGDRSPYPGSDLLTRTSGFYARSQPFQIEGGTAAAGGAVNYLLVVRDSPATRPLKAVP